MENPISAHRFSIHHRAILEQSEKCGCFYCLAIFAPAEIEDWIDGGDTAQCPRCGIDAVIGDDCGVPITPEFLEKMKTHWF